jgi:hypothetical protein
VSTFAKGFQLELDKLAFKYEDARKIVGLAKKVQAKDPVAPIRALLFGPHAAGSAREIPSQVVEGIRAQMPKVVEKPLAALAERKGITVPKVTRDISERLRKSLGMNPQEWQRAIKEDVMPQIEKYTVPLAGREGTVTLPHRDYTAGLLSSIAKSPKPLSTREKAFLEGLVASHEMSEREMMRRGPKAPFAMALGHAHPEVILRESAAAATAPEEFKNVAELMAQLRRRGYEDEIIRQATGGRARYGFRFNRSARKALAKDMEEASRERLREGLKGEKGKYVHPWERAYGKAQRGAKSLWQRAKHGPPETAVTPTKASIPERVRGRVQSYKDIGSGVRKQIEKLSPEELAEYLNDLMGGF